MLSTALTLFMLTAGGSGTCNCEDLQKEVDALKKRVEALEKRPATRRRPERKAQAEAYKIPVGDSPILGSKRASVHVVVFSDLQCPFCARVDPMFRDLVKDPELKGKVNVVFKHFPLSFHKDARPAAKATMAAREQGEEFFWKMMEKCFENQRALTSENFSRWAAEIGLDVGRFERDLKRNDARYERIINEDIRVGQRDALVRGTPSIFVNGWQLRQRSVDGVKNVIKEKNLLR